MFATSREFLFFLSKRAKNDTIFRVAASLSYTSLIAIVPLFAIGLAIFSAFPVFNSVRGQIEDFLLKNFVPTIEQEVSQTADHHRRRRAGHHRHFDALNH